MKLLALASAGIAALCVHAPALAQSQGNNYFTVNVGAAFPPDQDLDGVFLDDVGGVETPFASETEFDPSFFGSIVWGHRFSPSNVSGFGVEIEGFYHALNPEGFAFGGLDLDPNVNDAEEFFAGNASAFGGMVNGVYHLRSDSPWSARLGGGVGYARVSYDIDNAFDEGDGGLVYQGFAGLEYAFSESFAMNVTGRYLGLSDTEIRDDSFRADAQLNSIVATVGFSWTY